MAVPRNDDEGALIARDVEAYLRAHEQKELLRFVAVGSVDDGKSTLIGRLLHDTHGVYEDQLSAVKRASIKGATRGEAAASEIDFSLFTDGLKAEREQGITIDVAYRYFSTRARKFIIADTPGHVQYTRNMATGASTADAAVILIDARLGVLPQSRRHAYIAALLGIPQLVVGVNKMDLRGWTHEAFEAVRAEFAPFAARLGFAGVTFLPLSALKGDNVVHASANMPWWQGGTLLGALETLPLEDPRTVAALRFPVQYVIRPDLTYRGFAGQLAAGVVRPGDEVMALPSRRRARVVAVDTYEGLIAEASAPMSVSLRLSDEIDVSRGDMLVHPDAPPRVGDRFAATVVWLSERPLDPARAYLVKHTTQLVHARVEQVASVTDPETLEPRPAATLGLNDIGRVAVRTRRPIFYDPYALNRATGAFVLIDAISNDTVGAGMILADPPPPPASGAADDAAAARGPVTPAERRARLGQSGAVVALAARDAEAALALARRLERALFDRGRLAAVLEPAGDAPGEAAAARAVAGAGLIAIIARAGAAEATATVRAGEGETHVASAAAPLVDAVLEVLAARGLFADDAAG